MSLHVFITGGANGLGRELAKCWIAQGAQVLIGDVDREAVEQTAGEIGAAGIPCDVRVEADFIAVCQWIETHWDGRLDLLVNNAGVAQMGPIEKTALGDWQWIMDINVLGTVRACHTLLPLMPPGARIVNIASMAALVHLPNASAYNASKSAVLAISETWMLELEARGITVHVVCPAFFRSGLAANMRATDERAAATTTRLVERSRLDAAAIAERILRGVEAGEPHIFTHPQSRKSWLLKRYLPFSWFQKLMRKQLKKLDARLSRPQRAS